MDETTPVEEWARLLPLGTLVVSDPNAVLPIREINDDPAPSLPDVDVQGDCGRRPHGAAYAARCHQPACEVVSAITASGFQPPKSSADMNEEEIAVSRSRRGAQLIL